MRGFYFSAICGLLSSLCLSAQDTTHVEQLSESVVVGVRAQKNAPYAVANLERGTLSDFSSTGRELPMLFARTPGILAWGENGLGTGTSYLRIRGAGDSRINVTLDGVPLNSPEDQCVFWANMNSYASLMGSVQIQRGVGSSTNGDGAFGGTVSLKLLQPSYVPTAELSSSFGSYNTFNVGGRVSTGLMWKHLVGELAYHETGTDGYLHGTQGRSGNFYGGLSWLGRGFVVRYHIIYNFEHTGQAWNGVTAGNDDQSLMDGTYGESTGIKTYKDLYDRGLGRFNSLYESLVYDDASYSFPKNAEGNYQTERYTLKDGTLWPGATDNFRQDHNILSISGRFSSRLSGTASLHYTFGEGYYDEFRPNNKLKKFGLAHPTVSRSDFVRQKGLRQHQYGIVGNINYKDADWDIIGGISAQRFTGNHYGYLTYVGNDELAATLPDRYQYYDSDAQKNDASAYIKSAYRIDAAWSVFADVQLRFVGYKTDGVNDRFIKQADGTYLNQVLNIDKTYIFFNPKAGLSYNVGAHRAYASVSMSSREPERNNFTDNGSYPAPRPERLVDCEAGYQYSAPKLRLGANFYYMPYVDQFVQTGQVSDIGEALTTNIKSSYRLGAELTAAWDVLPWLSLEGNAALSRNRILDFDEHVEDWDTGEQIIHYDNSTLAFSPSAILNGFVDAHIGAFRTTWHTAYVSRMYLDNTANIDRSLPSHVSSDINMTYTLKFPRFVREVVFGVNLGNIFDSHYASSGWVYSAICESSGHPNDNRYYQIGFVPVAGFTAMGSITIRL